MRKVLVILLLAFGVFTVQAQKQTVAITYAQEEVFVVLDGILIGANPKSLKIDFELSKSLIFFKRGYYTQRMEIEPDVVIGKMKVSLSKKPETAAISQKTLLKLDTLLVSSIVTNMNKTDLWEIINSMFVKNNYYIGNSTALFPEAKNEISDSRYKLAIEIVDSDQIRHVYKAPRFLMGYIKIRWALLDKTTNEVVYFEVTEGSYFVQVDSPKGLVVSEKMLIVMEGAMKEAQFKLLTDEKFVNLVMLK